jgi:hypothetical protein
MYRLNMWMMPSDKQLDEPNFHCHPNFWKKMQKYGKEYGWQPAGTIKEKDYTSKKEIGDTTGDYEPGMYVTSEKIVGAVDALAWAEALEQLLADKAQIDKILKSNPEISVEGLRHVDESEYLDGMMCITVPYIERFVTFMKQGGFGFAWDD